MHFKQVSNEDFPCSLNSFDQRKRITSSFEFGIDLGLVLELGVCHINGLSLDSIVDTSGDMSR